MKLKISKISKQFGSVKANKNISLNIESKKIHALLGENGAGKTTSIAKIARYYKKQGHQIMLAAGDTFRAAAIEQLQTWGERNDVPVVAQQSGSDSAAVIFDAVQSATSKSQDLLIADTAGRLHTQDHLMSELAKIKRVMQKQNSASPHEIMLVLDASMGQNALTQAKQFHEAIGIDSITLTKLDGTAKGGIVFAIANELKALDPAASILFVGAKGKMEMNIVPKYGYKIHGLLISGLQRSFSLKNILLPFKLIISFVQSIIIILSFRPTFVVGTGGFASFPIVFISSIFRIPTLIQEQNSFPGISNRLLSKYANYISVAYDKMEKYFPSKKIYKTGNPIRESIRSNKNLVNQRKKLNIKDSMTVIAVLGGSLGSDRINKTIKKNIEFLISKNIFIIWQCGKSYYNDYKSYNSDKIFVTDFFDDIDSIYFTSDIIIARSGALTLSELAIVSKPSILIPSPNVA